MYPYFVTPHSKGHKRLHERCTENIVAKTQSEIVAQNVYRSQRRIMATKAMVFDPLKKRCSFIRTKAFKYVLFDKSCKKTLVSPTKKRVEGLPS